MKLNFGPYLGTGGFLLNVSSELAGFVVQRILRLILLFFQSQSSWSHTVVIIGLREMPSRLTWTSMSLKSSSLSPPSSTLLCRRLTSVNRLEGSWLIPVENKCNVLYLKSNKFYCLMQRKFLIQKKKEC